MSYLEVEGLQKTFRARRATTSSRPAVADVSFQLDRGQTLALVGESGAGKSTVGALVLRLIEADAGRVVLDGRDVLQLGRRDLREFRQQAQIVFQDPVGALDPRQTIGDAVAEPLLVQGRGSRQDRTAAAARMLRRVGIDESRMHLYPRDLSGGQLQRVCIARVLILSPGLLVCDEPVSALDVSVQAQVMRLLRDLQSEFGLACIFITHDLSLVESYAQEVIVMRSGRIVERGRTDQLFSAPSDDYTAGLLDAIPNLVPRRLRVPAEAGRRPAPRVHSEPLPLAVKGERSA